MQVLRPIVRKGARREQQGLIQIQRLRYGADEPHQLLARCRPPFVDDSHHIVTFAADCISLGATDFFPYENIQPRDPEQSSEFLSAALHRHGNGYPQGEELIEKVVVDRRIHLDHRIRLRRSFRPAEAEVEFLAH